MPWKYFFNTKIRNDYLHTGTFVITLLSTSAHVFYISKCLETFPTVQSASLKLDATDIDESWLHSHGSGLRFFLPFYGSLGGFKIYSKKLSQILARLSSKKYQYSNQVVEQLVIENLLFFLTLPRSNLWEFFGINVILFFIF